MSFFSPLFFLGLLALALPVALHLWRRRVTRTMPFPALRFLAATRADQRHQMIRRRIVLALRCLALAALAAAFARPFFGTPPAATGRATVVVIDNSLSLQNPERWSALHRQTRAALGSPASGDTIGLLLMNPRPAWLVSPTRDTAVALAAFEDLKPSWHSTRAEPALRLAADVLAAAPARERRLIVLGDHQATGWIGTDFAKKLPPGVTVVFPDPVPAPANQAALTATAFNREGDAWIATATVRNFSTARQARTLSLFAESSASPLLTAPVALAAGDTETVRLALPAEVTPVPAFIRLSLDPDDFPADDTAWVAASATRTDRVLLLDRPDGAADHVATAYAALAALPPALRVSPPPAVAWPVAAVAILRDGASFAGDPAARLDAFLATGGSALVFLDGGTEQTAWLARHGIAITSRTTTATGHRIRDWTLDHPLVAPLAETNLRSLVGWEFGKAWSLPADTVDAVAFWTDGSVAVGEAKIGAGRLLIAGFGADRRNGDWPIHPAFVPFLHRAATHLLGSAAIASDAPLRVGAALPPLDAQASWQALAGPATVGTINPASIDAPGIYATTVPGAPRRLVSVALDPAESDLAPWNDGSPWLDLVSAEPAQSVASETLRAAATTDGERQNPLWWWALAALAAFALAELALANRTTR